jgi:alginate O-acetyltransferase complex protein AlgI
MGTVGELWSQLVHGGGSTVLTTPILLLIGLGIVMQFAPAEIGVSARGIFTRLGPVPQGILLSIVLIGTGILVTGQGVAPFIYYRF